MEMRDIKKIIMPDGRTKTFYRGENQTWSEIVRDVILPSWERYCNEHWVDFVTHESLWSFEKRTKNFLDRIGWLILLDGAECSGDSKFKEQHRTATQIPASECPADISDYLYSVRGITDAQAEDERFQVLTDKLDAGKPVVPSSSKRKKIKTRFERIEEIRKQHANAKMKWCIVDSENRFEYAGTKYTLPLDAAAYTQWVGEGDELRTMDRVLVVDDGCIMLYDQNVYPIEYDAA